MLESPEACLQMLIRYKDHDIEMHCDHGKRQTTNGPSTYAYLKMIDPSLCSAFEPEEAIEQPGRTAWKAIKEFKAAVTGLLTPLEHSLVSTVMAGMMSD